MMKLIPQRFLILFAQAWLFLCITLQGAEAGLADRFKQANLAYEKERYAAAIEGYQALLTNGWRSAAIYFNLGNAAFKSGKAGDAIYYYLKARELKPRDPDVRANLSFVRDSIGAVDSGSDNLILNFFSIGELLAATLVLFWIVSALFALRSLQPAWQSRIKPWLGVGLVLMVAAAATSFIAWKGTRPGQSAIARKSEVIVRFGPLVESQTAFTIRDGAELKVAGGNDQWVQIKDNRGRLGWVPKREVHLFP